MIQVNDNDVIDEIDKSIAQDPGNYGNSNKSSKTRPVQFINFSVTNKSDFFKQFTTLIEIIQVDLDNTEANNTVSILFGLKIKYYLREKVRKAKRK